MARTSHIFLPSTGNKINSLNRKLVGSGTGTVLLDGGRGGQSSYSSIDEYIKHTGNKVPSAIPKGEGLADRISSKLSKLNVSVPKGPKRKNISLSI